MKSSCKIKQHDLADCGVACLASIAAYHGLKVPIGRLRQYASTNRFGTNVTGLTAAADKISLHAKGVKAVLHHLAQLPAPFIAHVIRGQLQHYIVIYKISSTHVTYMDPADGEYHKEKLEEFAKCWTGVLILVVPKEEFTKQDLRQSTCAWFWQLVAPHRFLLIQSVIAALLYTILGLLPSFYIQKVVDAVLPGQNTRLLNLLSLIMLACLFIQIIIGYVKSLFVLQTGQFMDAKLILGYYRHLMRLPQPFFDNMQVGEIVSRVNDAVKIRSFINNTGIDMLLNIFIITFSILIMTIYNLKLTFLVVMVFPAYIIISVINNHVNKRWQRRLMENAAKLESQLVESLGNMRTIKRFAIEEFAMLKMETRFISLLQTVFKSSHYNIYISTATDLLLKLVSISMLYAGSYYVLENRLTVGELLSFYALLGYFTAPATSLIAANRNLQEASIATKRLLDITSLETEAGNTGKTSLSSDMVGDIYFEDVHFRYGTRNELFNGLTMKFRKGRSTAIVGESGSGKSTILSLLHNIYALQKGSIRIGDYNLVNLTNDSVRRLIAIVPQDIQLITGTIIDNIALGDVDPDIRRVLELCGLLGLNDFIEKLPESYNTFLGEQGMSLSGGQRQRLAIARALYRQPEILMLDEATASLDGKTELKVQEALSWYLRNGKTLIIIAHRLSTIRNCDEIKVLKQGRITEEGTHDALIRLNGQYKKMWEQSMNAPQDIDAI